MTARRPTYPPIPARDYIALHSGIEYPDALTEVANKHPGEMPHIEEVIKTLIDMRFAYADAHMKAGKP